MGQLTERSEPTMVMGGASFFLCRLEAVRHRENGWHEPYELRGSCTVLRGAGGEIPPAYLAIEKGTSAITAKIRLNTSIVGFPPSCAYRHNFCPLNSIFSRTPFYRTPAPK